MSLDLRIMGNTGLCVFPRLCLSSPLSQQLCYCTGHFATRYVACSLSVFLFKHALNPSGPLTRPNAPFQTPHHSFWGGGVWKITSVLPVLLTETLISFSSVAFYVMLKRRIPHQINDWQVLKADQRPQEDFCGTCGRTERKHLCTALYGRACSAYRSASRQLFITRADTARRSCAPREI